MKVVHKGLALERKFSRRNFLTERDVMLSVNESESAGRFLMSVLMCWEDVEKDLVYFVMPLHRTDLATALLRKVEIPMHDRYLWCKELLCALVYLLHLGILHKDIKPSNILIDTSGRAVLTDFGNAREVPIYEYSTWKGYSRDGTYPYMAPEMVSADVGTVGYGTGVDVWSMGLVLMEIIGFCDGPFFHKRRLEDVQQEHANPERLPIDPDKFLCSEPPFCEILPAVCASCWSVMLPQLLTCVTDVASRSEEADHGSSDRGQVHPVGRLGFGPRRLGYS
ncbi:kinase-like protein [Lentinus tigrinus ALCF2SS1-7]|uniref:Kinase-like protein n=1 Tax=Lentinus tigrinus ALCF2SS1-6 TaxID=1328759 RepID=A0A5C2RWY8_9APHY|nr:kinase-like protein [Lentinus tigrinus ALCF2SS1-6]RPD71288.1 kinase-like protein [Lentinus tigrinus ALCF2SS1-7]